MTSVVLVVTALKIVFLALPLSVASLAFRRLLISQTSNAWLYGSVMLFAIVTTLGMLPWVAGIAAPAAVFLIFAALSPMAWIGVLMLCGSRGYRMDNNDMVDEANVPDPLLLTDPVGTAVPTFRHSRPQSTIAGEPEVATDDSATLPAAETGPRSLLTIAREMRGGARSSTLPASPPLLPPPSPEAQDLPFIHRPATT